MEKLIQEIVRKAVDEAMHPYFEQIFNQNQAEPELLTTKEACQFLKVKSENTLQALCIQYDVLPRKLGGRNRYRVSDLRRMLGEDNNDNPVDFA